MNDKDIKISLQDIIGYFLDNDEGCQENTDEFVYKINVNGFDPSVSEVLKYAVISWADEKPGYESGYASRFVDLLLAQDEHK